MGERISNFLRSNTGLGIAIGIALIIATLFCLKTLKPHTIAVKGAHSIPMVSDIGVMRFSLEVTDKNPAEALKKLDMQTQIVSDYLQGLGFGASALEVTGTYNQKVYKKTYVKEGEYTVQRVTDEVNFYKLNRHFTIETQNLEKLKSLETQIFSLMEKGVDIQASPAEFIVSNLEDVKLKALEQAIENARKRATLFIASTPSKSLSFNSASQGVFQITPPHDTGINEYGRDDKTTIKKIARSVVTVHYNVV